MRQRFLNGKKQYLQGYCDKQEFSGLKQHQESKDEKQKCWQNAASAYQGSGAEEWAHADKRHNEESSESKQLSQYEEDCVGYERLVETVISATVRSGASRQVAAAIASAAMRAAMGSPTLKSSDGEVLERLESMGAGLQLHRSLDTINGRHCHNLGHAVALARPMLDPAERRVARSIQKQANSAKHDALGAEEVPSIGPDVCPAVLHDLPCSRSDDKPSVAAEGCGGSSCSSLVLESLPLCRSESRRSELPLDPLGSGKKEFLNVADFKAGLSSMTLSVLCRTQELLAKQSSLVSSEVSSTCAPFSLVERMESIAERVASCEDSLKFLGDVGPGVASSMMKRSEDRSSVPCRFFQSGACKKAERCRFSHAPVMWTETAACQPTSSQPLRINKVPSSVAESTPFQSPREEPGSFGEPVEPPPLSPNIDDGSEDGLLGLTVRTLGLLNSPGFNDRFGTVLEFLSSSVRYRVQFDPKTIRALKRVNLQFPARCPRCDSEVTGSQCFSCGHGE